MVLGNDLRYTKEKYKILAEKLKMKYPRLFGPDTEPVSYTHLITVRAKWNWKARPILKSAKQGNHL